MSKRIVELYGDNDISRIKRRIKLWQTVILILAVAAFAACVTLIALTDTENASRTETAVIAISTLAGWIVIYCAIFIVTAARREIKHAEMLRTDERVLVEGGVTVTDERVRIKKSITARRVEISADCRTQKALVCETRAKALANAGAVALYTVHGFAAAYEVTP